MEKPLWATVLITRNEEAVIARAMESLKEFRERGGQVVVCDTGSTDKTAEIARSYGCTVEEVGDRFVTIIDKKMADEINSHFIVGDEESILKEGDRIFNFSAARNYAASLASCDMISMMDADEVFTKLDIDAINAKIREGYTGFEYHFIFNHDAYGNPGISFTQSKFYSKAKQAWTNYVHEVLSGQVRTIYLPQNIFLLEHYQNLATNRSGYLRGLAYDCYRNPDNDRNSHYFAREMMYCGRYRSAIKEFERHIAMNRWQAEKSQSVVFMGQCHSFLGENEKAVDCYQKAYQIEKGRREPFWRLMEHYNALNEPERVVAYGEAALTIPYSGFYADDMATYTNLVHERLYIAYWQIGDREKSREHFYKAWKHQPLNAKYLYDLRFYRYLPKISVIVPTLGRPEGLAKCEESIKKQSYPQEQIETIILSGEGTVPEKVKKGLEQATGEYIVYAANDTELDVNCLLFALFDSEENNKALVSFNEGTVLPDEGNICAHFMIRRDFISQLDKGEIFDTDFHHVGVDNYLWAQAKKKEQAFHSERAKLTHNHFSTTGKMDEVYQKGWSKVEQDRETLKRKLDIMNTL